MADLDKAETICPDGDCLSTCCKGKSLYGAGSKYMCVCSGHSQVKPQLEDLVFLLDVDASNHFLGFLFLRFRVLSYLLIVATPKSSSKSIVFLTLICIFILKLYFTFTSTFFHSKNTSIDNQLIY